MENWLLEAEPHDPVTAGAVDVYLAKRTTFFPDASNRTYRGWLSQAMSVSRSMFGKAVIGGNSLPSFGAAVLTVGDEFRAERTRFKRLRWAGRPVRIYQGTRGAALATYTKRFDGYFSGQPDFEKMRVALPLGDLQTKFTAPFQPATYSGAGGFNGGADLKGRHKLDAVGIVRGATGIWVDQANGWMDLCASGFHTVYAVKDGADEISPDASNPPASGQYYIDAANGRLRFGSLPNKQYTVDFRSNFSSGALTIGAICSAAATGRLGFGGGQVDSAAFTALDVARPYAAGWFAQNGETYAEMWDYLIGGALAFYTTSPTGLLTAVAVKAPVATSKTHAAVTRVITDRDIVPNSFRRIGYVAPPHTVNILARRNWTPLTDDQLVTLAAQPDKDFARAEWRTVPKANATTLTEFPQSVPFDWQSPFDDLTEADTFGTTVMDLITAPRPSATVTLAIPPFGSKLGDEVWVSSAVNEVEAPAIVASVDENETDFQVRLGLYALTEQ